MVLFNCNPALMLVNLLQILLQHVKEHQISLTNKYVFIHKIRE